MAEPKLPKPPGQAKFFLMLKCVLSAAVLVAVPRLCAVEPEDRAADPADTPSLLSRGAAAAGFLKGAMKEIAPLANELAAKAGWNAGSAPDGTPAPAVPEAPPEQAAPEQTAEPLSNISKGTALEAFLMDSLRKSLPDAPDADKAAVRAAGDLKPNEANLPQDVLSSLSGTRVKIGQTKGSLMVHIEDEIDHREMPGFSNENIETLQTALSAADKPAVVELLKKDWKLENGVFRKEKKPPKNARETARVTVLLSNYGNGTFQCRKTKAGGTPEIGRLHEDDLRLGGTAFVLATVEWTPECLNPVTLPADFRYDKTLVLPGQFAFLALPFQKQGKGGICVAASALNVVSYIDPGFNLEQRELFALYNGGKSGATLTQLIGGLGNVGFETEYLATKSVATKELMSKIRAGLDAGRPMVIFQPGHALTLIGYNKPNRTLIVWDQRAHRPGTPDYLPRGGFEVTESAFASRFSHIFFIRKADDKPGREEEEKLVAFLGGTSRFLKHTLANANQREERLDQYARHAGMPNVTALLRAGRTVFILKGKKELISIPPQESETFQATILPSGEPAALSRASVIRAILDAGGVFYSSANP